MNSYSFIFAITCFVALVGPSVQANIDVGEILIDFGTAVKNCVPKLTFGSGNIGREIYCTTACMAKEFRVLGADNKVNISRVEELSQEYKRFQPRQYQEDMKILQNCTEEVTDYSDECAVVKNLIQCEMITRVKMLF